MIKPDHFIVVDDDRSNNLISEFNIRRISKSANIEVFTNPEEALSMIEEKYEGKSGQGPILLFLDLNMPSMTGWEFLEIFGLFPETLRQQFSIYILTSSIEDLGKEVESFSFVSGVICKPLKFDMLEEIFSKFIEPEYI